MAHWQILLEHKGRIVLCRPLDTFPFTIGRDHANLLELLDDDVSRRHCTIECHEGKPTITDHSRNGTLINGQRLSSATCNEGDKLKIGPWTLHLSRQNGTRHDETVIPTPSPPQNMGGAIGVSQKMSEIFSLIERVAPTRSNVLITGESGTGKELMARVLHERGTTPSGPFVAVNCGALPSSMIEAIIFGHERGAFTGAVERTAGLFEQAHGGTLFLDEIGEMPLDMQTRLLRVLEEGSLRRIGGRTEIPINTRLVTATNRSLMTLVSEEKFRADLFYRLYVIPIHLPPLRERAEDVDLLAEHFVNCFSPPERSITLTAAAREKLRAHSWPGNVRELKNTIQRSVLVTTSSVLDADLITLVDPNAPYGDDGKLLGAERAAIITSLKRFTGNCSRVAYELGIARTTLAAKMRRHAIDPNEFRK